MHKEIKISSYILKPNVIIRDLDDQNLHEYFINIEDIEKLITIRDQLDSDYLDGYISIIYNNRTIMGPIEWDLVNQLWAYILNMIQDLQKNKSAKTYFPDQPLELAFTLFGSEVLVELYEGKQKHIIPKDPFIKSLLNAAYIFFTAYDKIFGSKDTSAQYQLDKIKELKKSLKL